MTKFTTYFLGFTLLLFGKSVNAQSIVSGKVQASDGSALPGVSVLIKGTQTGTVTDTEGNYRINAPADGTLVYSFIGFESTEAPVGGQSVLDVSLVESTQQLAELVFVGSRSVGRTKLETPAPVDVIDVTEVAAVSPQVDLAQLLVATAPSFNAVRSQGGDLSSHVDPPTLRGLAPNQMLVLVNGKRRHTSALLNSSQTGTFANAVDMHFIPTSSIARVEILRDGAAAQYGSDAIAGVMNIILKESTGKLTGNLTVGAFPNFGTPNFENDESPLTAGERAQQDLVPREMDGESYQFDANYGFAIGSEGYLNVTGLLRQDRPAIRPTVLDYANYTTFDGTYLNNERTDKTGNPIITNPELLAALSSPDGMYNGFTAEELSTNVGLMDARGITQYDVASYLGQPALNLGSMSYNMGLPLAGDFEFFANGDIGFKYIEGFSCFYRSPSWHSRAGAFGLYPNGFRPQMTTNQTNVSSTLGVAGEIGDYSVSVSNTFGRNLMDIGMLNTINVTYGDQSPVEMDLGRHSFMQNTSNVDISRYFPDVLRGLNVAAGAEMRIENYRIEAGQEESYLTSTNAGRFFPTSLDQALIGPDGMPLENQSSSPIVDADGNAMTAQPFNDPFLVKNYSTGNQCFTAFSTDNEANEYRTVTGAYLDLELDVTDQWLVAGAARAENYLDFGSVLNGKIATRYSLTDNMALRGSFSTGFRAPSLQELNYSHTFTFFVNTIPADATIHPNRSAEARVLGIGELKEETSTNVSLGFATTIFDKLNLSIDAYEIEIKNRIFQTDNFDATEAPVLEPLIGDGLAAFRINGGTISSRGIEIVANYSESVGAGTLGLTLAATFRDNQFEKATVPDLNTNLTEQELIDKYVRRDRVAQFETGTPNTRLIGTINYSIGKFSAMIRPSYFGEVTSREFNETTLVDVRGEYDIETGTPPALLDAEGNAIVDFADQTYDPELIFDIGVNYAINSNLTLAVGGNNVFNNLPDIIRYENRDFGLYSNYQQGSGGAYYFSRLSFSF